MDDSELEKKKKELMAPGWTEDLQHELEELSIPDAKKIVESMTDSEIYRKVNNRRMQEDYIADYLEYLWEISTSAYWRQLMSTLDVNVGVLWGGDMPHFWKMCHHRIPPEVFNAILNFAAADETKKVTKQDFDAIGCVVRAQVKEFGRLEEVKTFIASLREDLREKIEERILGMIDCECGYHFFN
jgi:hypothetical protein